MLTTPATHSEAVLPASGEAAPTDAERWLAAFIAGWRAPAGPQQFVQHFRPWLSPQVRLLQPQLPQATGHRGFEEQFVRPLFGLIPDVRGTVERWAARGDVIYIELTLSGHLAGRPVRWRVCDRVTLRDGVAIERESYCDPTPLLAALALTPRAWPRLLRLQLGRLVNHITGRRKT